jgi:hypothetical protein
MFLHTCSRENGKCPYWIKFLTVHMTSLCKSIKSQAICLKKMAIFFRPGRMKRPAPPTRDHINRRTRTQLWINRPLGANLVPRACDPREGTRGSGIIRCRKPGILAKIELRIPFQRPISFLPETDYPRASRSFPPRIAGSGNEIAWAQD